MPKNLVLALIRLMPNWPDYAHLYETVGFSFIPSESSARKAAKHATENGRPGATAAAVGGHDQREEVLLTDRRELINEDSFFLTSPINTSGPKNTFKKYIH